MAPRFTWERGPFEECPRCRRQAFGLLSAGRSTMTLRCTEPDCRYSESVRLPDVQKEVVYLDQNALSIMFKVRSGGRLPKGHEKFSHELLRLTQRALLLQQVVFPHSDIHHDETTVFAEAEALRQAYKAMGGDVRLEDVDDVELSQTLEVARAKLENRKPQFSFDVDQVLARDRNEWLPDMQITVNTDYSQFAASIRASRDRAHKSVKTLVAQWAKEKPSYEDVLAREISAYGPSKVRAFFQALNDWAVAMQSGDIEAAINSSAGPIMREHRALEFLFAKAGVPEEDRTKRVVEFWQSEEAADQPFHVIFAHLFAAVARRVSLGQRSFTRGLMNDVRAISAYGPYVDAMFLDREFELILKETPQLRKLPIKARIFSFGSADEFLGYLSSLCERASPEVTRFASRIYGLG